MMEIVAEMCYISAGEETLQEKFLYFDKAAQSCLTFSQVFAKYSVVWISHSQSIQGIDIIILLY